MGIANHTMFLMNDGTVKGCGFNGNGQLGIGNTIDPMVNITDILNLSNVKSIICGGYHTIFLMNDGTVKGVGRNDSGQLGIGNNTDPITTITDIPISNVKSISCGSYHTMFLMNDGTVKGCGFNIYGQVGVSTTDTITTITDIPISNVKSISCGIGHTIFLMNDYTVKGCGFNSYGQLGLGTTTYKYDITDIPISSVKSISCGAYHTMFLMNDNTVKGVGQNTDGVLGIGNTIDPMTTITDIPNLIDVKSIICGGYHTMFLMNDNTVKGVGVNNYGQLGIGNTTNQSTIIDVPINVKHIICGNNYTMFLMDDGIIKGVGQNANGQLGISNTTNQTTTINIPINNVYVADSYMYDFNYIQILKYILSINPIIPSDAIVEIEIDGVWVVSVSQELPNGTYNYRVSKDGYDTKLGNVTILDANESIDVSLDIISESLPTVYISKSGEVTISGEDKTILVILNPKKYTVTFNTTPADCTIDIMTDGGILSGPVVELKSGEYDYQVSKTDYGTKTGTLAVNNADTTIDVILDLEVFNATINPTPSDATVSVEIGGVWTTGTTYRLENGTYNYKVTKAEYITNTGTFTINNGDIIINETLELEYNLFITPIPVDATVEVEIDNVWTTGLQFKVGIDTYNYRISKDGYVTQTSSVNITDLITKHEIDVTLQLIKYTLTITPTPIDAVVEVEIDGVWAAGTSHQLPNGTYNYKVSKTDYITEQGIVTITDSDNDIAVDLPPVLYTLTIIPTPVDSIVEIEIDGVWTVGTSHQLPTGTYNYKVSKTGYVTVQESCVVNGNTDLTVTLEVSLAYTKIANLDPMSVSTIQFSKSNNYVMIRDTNHAPYFILYNNNNDVFTNITSNVSGLEFTPAGTMVGVRFDMTADDNYIVITSLYEPPYMQILKKSGDSYVRLADTDIVGTQPDQVQDVSISNDGKYVVMAKNGGEGLVIFERSGDTFTRLPDPFNITYGDTISSCNFSPDNMHLVITHTYSPYVIVYKNNLNGTFTKLSLPTTNVGNPYSCIYSPDGLYLAITGQTAVGSSIPALNIYKRVGDSYAKLSSINITTLTNSSTLYDCSFSTDSKYVILNYNETLLLERDGDIFTEIDISVLGLSTGHIHHYFSEDSNYIYDDDYPVNIYKK